MAQPKQPVDNKQLRVLINQILMELEPSLRNDPQKLNNIMMAIEQDFYALAQKRSDLVYQTVSALQPLVQYLAGKQLELHMAPHLKMKPDPMKSLAKSCDDLINEICADDEQLKKELKQYMRNALDYTSDPSKGPGAVMGLQSLNNVLKDAKKNFTTKGLYEFLSDKDKANISYYSMDPESGSQKTTLTKTEPSPYVVHALTDAIEGTVAAKMKAPGQPIDEANEIQKQNESGWKVPTPFDGMKKPTPDK